MAVPHISFHLGLQIAGSSDFRALDVRVFCRNVLSGLLPANTSSYVEVKSPTGRSFAARQLRLCAAFFPELLGEPDKKSFGTADVAETIRLFVLNHIADELRATLAESGKRVVDVVHREHDAQVAERVHRGVPVIGDDGRGEESRKLEPAMAVRGDEHGDLDVLIPQPGDAPSPLSLDGGSPFEFQAELDEEGYDGIEGFDDDADVVHPLDSHIVRKVLIRCNGC